MFLKTYQTTIAGHLLKLTSGKNCTTYNRYDATATSGRCAFHSFEDGREMIGTFVSTCGLQHHQIKIKQY